MNIREAHKYYDMIYKRYDKATINLYAGKILFESNKGWYETATLEPCLVDWTIKNIKEVRHDC